MEYATLYNGVKMPILGYGVYQVTKEECERCVLDALRAGYRSIDTSQSYANEEEVGEAIEKSGKSVEDVLAAFRSVMVDARRDNGTWVCIGLDGRGCNQLT